MIKKEKPEAADAMMQAAEAIEAALQQPKKRGRKPKAAEEPPAGAAPKKRGRPPKKRDPLPFEPAIEELAESAMLAETSPNGPARSILPDVTMMNPGPFAEAMEKAAARRKAEADMEAARRLVDALAGDGIDIDAEAVLGRAGSFEAPDGGGLIQLLAGRELAVPEEGAEADGAPEPMERRRAARPRTVPKKAGMRKTFVIDTNVIMSDPDCFRQFDDNLIVIPDAVIEELDRHKGDPGDAGYNVRKACRELDRLGAEAVALPGGGLEMPVGDNGGALRFTSESSYGGFPEGWDCEKNDNRILAAANAIPGAIVVSRDTNMRIKARILGIPVQEYRHEAVEEDYLTYRGRTEAYAGAGDFLRFMDGEPIAADALEEAHGKPLIQNEFVVLKNRADGSELLGRICGECLVPLRHAKESPFGIRPRNLGQVFAMEALMAPADEIPLVIMTGSAGTAKTLLALACSLDQIEKKELYRRITVCRANVEFDRDIGALPGSEEDKVGPLLRGCMDNLEQFVPNGVTGVERRFQDEIIKAEALGFLRGRTLVDQVLYIDEAQNTSVSQMNGILTRCGEGTKIIITGDLNQIDTPRLDRHNNGLAHAIKLMAGEPDCAIAGFLDSEATRSSLARKVAEKISGQKQ